MPKSHHQLSDNEFESQFQNCKLDPSLFTHEAHIRLAWIHIRKYGGEKACEQICRQIQQFDKVHGDGRKFHKTLTVAAVKIVEHFIMRSKADNFSRFMVEYLRLKHGFKSLIDQHYSKALLNTNKAKLEYLPPDLMPFE